MKCFANKCRLLQFRSGNLSFFSSYSWFRLFSLHFQQPLGTSAEGVISTAAGEELPHTLLLH
jgi:hypothetical protein